MRVEAYQVKKIKVSDARSQLQVTQQELAQRAGISKVVVSNAENGYFIRRLSAHAILNALNAIRQERGMSPLDFDAMDWKVQGE